MKEMSFRDAKTLDSRGTTSSQQSSVIKPHKDYMVVFGQGDFYQRKSDETL